MISYQGSERELYTEALRTVAAIVSARAHGRFNDVLALHQAYQQVARELGVAPCNAWAIMSSAAVVSMVGLVEHIAELEGGTVHAVADRMVFAAVERVASGAL